MKLLTANYIIDGVPMGITPALMLSECTISPPSWPGAPAASIVDEQMDPSPETYRFLDAQIPAYERALKDFTPAFPLPFAQSATIAAAASALIELIWQGGHFHLEDLCLKPQWRWDDTRVGHPAAFYNSVEAACAYADALGIKFSTYRVLRGEPSLQFKALLSPEAGLSPETDLAPCIFRRRKCPALIQPRQEDWLLYIPFDPCDFRLGGSALVQALGESASVAPDLGDAQYMKDCYEVVRELVEDGIVKAGITVGEEGLLKALRNFCSAGTGADISLTDVCKAYGESLQTRILFSQVPGVIIQIADMDFDYVDAELLLQDVAYFPIGHPGTSEAVNISDKGGIPSILESLLSSLEGED